MDAQTAANQVQNATQLNNQDLLEVYKALKDSSAHKRELNQLMQARGTDIEALIDKNLTDAETFSKVNVMDPNNPEFATSRDYLNNLQVQDEQGQPVDVKAEIVELAKLQTTADFSERSTAFTQDDYNSSLKDNIDINLFHILLTHNVIQQPQPQNQVTAMSQAVDNVLNGKTQTVSTDTVGGVLALQMDNLKKKAQAVAKPFKALKAITGLRQKIQQLGQNLKTKLKQSYTKASAYIKALNEQGVLTDVAFAAIAGLGGPTGMAIYGAYTLYRRVRPLVKDYKKEKQNNPNTNVREYMKNHKKDVIMASLYTATAVASLTVGGIGIVQGFTNSASAAVALPPLTDFKYIVGTGAAVGRSAIDVATAETEEDKKKAWRRAGFSMAALFGGQAIAHAASDYFNAPSADGATENVDASPAPGTGVAAENAAGEQQMTAENAAGEQQMTAEKASAETPATPETPADAEVELPTQWNKDMGISPKQFNTLFNHPETQFIGGRDALESAYEHASKLSSEQMASLGVKSPEELLYKFSRLEFQLGVDKAGNLLVGDYAVDSAHPDLGNFTTNKLNLEKLLNCGEIVQKGGAVQPSDLAGMKALLDHIDQNGQYHGIGDHVITHNVPNGGTGNDDCHNPNRPNYKPGSGRVVTHAPSNPAPVVETPENPVVETPETPVVETPENPVVETPENPVVVTPENPVVETPENPVVVTPENPVVETPEPPVEKIPVINAIGNEGVDQDMNKESGAFGGNLAVDKDGHVIMTYTQQNYSGNGEGAQNNLATSLKRMKDAKLSRA